MLIISMMVFSTHWHSLTSGSRLAVSLEQLLLEESFQSPEKSWGFSFSCCRPRKWNRRSKAQLSKYWELFFSSHNTNMDAEPASFQASAQVISRDSTTFLSHFRPLWGLSKVPDLRVMMGSKSRVCVATSEAQTWPIWISRDMMSS